MTDREYAQKLFAAINADDKYAFQSLLNEDRGIDNLRISLGRFPLLSLIYLCKAKRIARAYEKRLLSVSDYVVIFEPIDAYLVFKKVAKRSLRLYVYGDAFLSPTEALAIIDEREKLAEVTKGNGIGEREKARIIKIFRLTNGVTATASASGVSIPQKPLGLAQLIALALIIVIAAGAIFAGAFSSGSLFKKYGGDGSEGNPLFITGPERFLSALSVKEGDVETVLKTDVTIDELTGGASYFTGVIDGEGHTLTIKEASSALFGDFAGTLKNLNIVVEKCEYELFEDSAVLAIVNSGKIMNVNLTVNAVLSENISDPNPDDEEYPEIYFGTFVAKNRGEIRDCTLNGSLDFVGNGSGNMYLGGFAGVNDGTIVNCKTSDDCVISTQTVDIGGVVAHNGLDGVVTECVNGAKITQISDVKTWLPNVGGVACTNEGRVENCKNTAELRSESTVMVQEGENLLVVYLGGVVCNNKAEVVHCQNKGDLYAVSGIYSVVVGGIVANNTYLTDKNGQADTFASIKNSGSFGKITANTKKTTVKKEKTEKEESEGEEEGEEEPEEVENEQYYMYVGGVAAYCVGSSVENSFSLADYSMPEGRNAGGIVGGCYISGLSVYASVKSCAYLQTGAAQYGLCYGDKSLANMGYIGKYDGDSKREKEDKPYCITFTSGAKLKESEVFWE